MIAILHNLFPKIEAEGSFFNSLHEASIILILKPNKDIMRKNSIDEYFSWESIQKPEQTINQSNLIMCEKNYAINIPSMIYPN